MVVTGADKCYMATFIVGQKFLIKEINRYNEHIDMNVIEIHEGELTTSNLLTEELTIDFNCKASDSIIGYAGYLELLNGFKKSVYWSIEQIEKYRKSSTNWIPGGIRILALWLRKP